MKMNLAIGLLFVGSISAQSCPTANVFISGSSTVLPVAEEWGEAYTNICNLGYTKTAVVPAKSPYFSVLGGGSSKGRTDVCAGVSDIGNMSREWAATEASSSNQWEYNCKVGTPGRKVVRVDVAIDGVTFVVKKGGTGGNCIANFQKSLSADQLRWIYSSFTITALKQKGWSESALANGVGLVGRKWNNLNKNCEAKEINLAVPGDNSGTQAYFREKIFKDSSENFFSGVKPLFKSESDLLLKQYVQNDPAAITFFGFAYYFEDTKVVKSLYAIAVKNRAGKVVFPSKVTIGSGEYNPFTRRIYMNIGQDRVTKVRGYLEYGFSTPGDALVVKTGYNALPVAEQVLMMSRIGSSKGINFGAFTCGAKGTLVISYGAAAQRTLLNVYAIHYTDKCPLVNIQLNNANSNLFPVQNACGSKSPQADIGVTAVKSSIKKCPAPSTRTLIEIKLHTDEFAYVNNALARKFVSSGYLKFALGEGSKLPAKVNLPNKVLPAATRVAQIALLN